MKYSQLFKGLINFDPDGYKFREDVRQLIKAAKEGKSADEILKKQAEGEDDYEVEYLAELPPPNVAIQAPYDVRSSYNLIPPWVESVKEPKPESGIPPLVAVGTGLGGTALGWWLKSLESAPKPGPKDYPQAPVRPVVNRLKGRRAMAPKAAPAIEWPERQLTFPWYEAPPPKQPLLPGFDDLMRETSQPATRQLTLPGLGAAPERQLTLPGFGGPARETSQPTAGPTSAAAAKTAPREPSVKLPGFDDLMRETSQPATRQLTLPGLGAAPERQLTLPGFGGPARETSQPTAGPTSAAAAKTAPREPSVKLPEDIRQILLGKGQKRPVIPDFDALVKAVADDVRKKAQKPQPGRPGPAGISMDPRFSITDPARIVQESVLRARQKLMAEHSDADIKKMLDALKKRQAKVNKRIQKQVAPAKQRFGRTFGRMKGAR